MTQFGPGDVGAVAECVALVDRINCDSGVLGACAIILREMFFVTLNEMKND